jgi:hypothetical protein
MPQLFTEALMTGSWGMLLSLNLNESQGSCQRHWGPEGLPSKPALIRPFAASASLCRRLGRGLLLWK